MTDETRACPWCGETILAVAKKCKHCGEFLSDERPDATAATDESNQVVTCDVEGCELPVGRNGAKCPAHAAVRAGRVLAEPAFGGSVWEFSGMRWKCLAHGKGICTECNRKMKVPSHKAKKGDRLPPPGAHQMVCPHCQTKGQVKTQVVKQKKGISGGKATAAVFTAGISMVGTGLSRKEMVTEAHCSNCGSTWHY